MKNYFEDIEYICHEPNSIELIGYAMNDISKAKKLASQLPADYSQKLSNACALLYEVQEYLYEH